MSAQLELISVSKTVGTQLDHTLALVTVALSLMKMEEVVMVNLQSINLIHFIVTDVYVQTLMNVVMELILVSNNVKIHMEHFDVIVILVLL